MIKNEIFFHLRLYNLHFNKIFRFNIDEIRNYKYYGYLDKIEVLRNYNRMNEPIQQLPYGISDIKILQNHILFNKLNETTIPKSVHTFRFCDHYSQPINIVKILPPSLTLIEFGVEFNEILEKGVIPNGVKTIIFKSNYNQPINSDGVFPPSLTSIEFGSGRSKRIISMNENRVNENYQIENVEKNDENDVYFFNSVFNKMLLKSNPIPISLKCILKFDNEFNQKITENKIPNNITSILFGKCFNSQIKINSLPINLTSIEFGKFFNQSINLSYLIHLKSIEFGDFFNESFKLPKENLTSLKFGHSFNLPISKEMTLPPTLTYLSFGSSWCFNDYSLNSLNQLETLIFSNGYKDSIKLGQLPKSIKKLYLGREFNNIIEKDVLPNNLTTLSLCGHYNKSIEKGSLPMKLSTLSLSFDFNQPIIEKDILPKSLTSLTFGYRFNQIIEVGVLPNSITLLSLGNDYKKDFPIGSLPTSLKILKINSETFNQDLSSPFDDYFTSSFETLYISEKSKLVNILNPYFFSKFIKYN
ncbi:hypothetical protein ACTFIU_001664 [Dictyostelium citrinum]